MRKVILYIGVSLDGYIADSKGSVNWIEGQDEHQPLEDTFTPFFGKVDTVIMGRKTYDQIVTVLAPDRWPYLGATSYVITHNSGKDERDNIRFQNTDVCSLVKELKQEEGNDIWICGGAEIAGELMQADMIDCYHLAIVPTILGGGVRLFGRDMSKIDLQLAETKTYNGIVELIYKRRNIIRKMTDNDISRVMHIWLEGNLKAHDFISPSYWQGQCENVRQLIQNAEVYVCERCGEISGFVGLSGNYIAGIFVDSEWQSKGIGKMLLDYVKTIKPRIQLHVYEKNERAIRFYKREDFVIVSESIDEHTGEKELLMEF